MRRIAPKLKTLSPPPSGLSQTALRLPLPLADLLRSSAGHQVLLLGLGVKPDEPTKQWEERPLVREGESAGTIAGIRSARQYYQNRAVYWRGSLYVHLPNQFVMRISLSDNKYQVIKPPQGRSPLFGAKELYIGKSKKGVYCAAVHNLVRDVNYYEECGEDAKDEAIVPQKFDWDSDSDNLIDPKSMADDESPRYTDRRLMAASASMGSVANCSFRLDGIGSVKGKGKGGDEVDLEPAMTNMNLKESELDDVFVGEE
ncbi:hypothetical protein ZWY2020_036163 [Hordeum vulgare]|nr:hypothetical protein ZWY2020_036163 [Hordeum vulgare]